MFTWQEHSYEDIQTLCNYKSFSQHSNIYPENMIMSLTNETQIAWFGKMDLSKTIAQICSRFTRTSTT